MLLININPRSSSLIRGKSFCFTGELSITRNEISEIVSNMGGIVKSTVSNGLDYLVAGYKSGSKEVKARRLGITILTEEELAEMLA